MKKTIIASAASVVLAAMPVVGVFAAPGDPAENPATITDTLTVNINGVCTFTRSGNGQYTQTMTAGQVKNDFGSSTLHTACNNAKGYVITATFANLTGSVAGSQAITYATTTPTAAAGETPASGLGTYTATIGGSNINLGQDALASSYVVANVNTMDPAAGSDYTVNYIVSTRDNQAQGTYSGNVVYTLTQNV